MEQLEIIKSIKDKELDKFYIEIPCEVDLKNIKDSKELTEYIIKDLQKNGVNGERILKKNKTECMKQYMKEYYQKNKEKIDKDCAIKVKCDCGMMVRKNNLSTHKLKSRHINKLNNKDKVIDEIKKAQYEFDREIRKHLQILTE